MKGVGPATADRIVARFGEDTLRVIHEEPQRLAEVAGLGAKRIEQLTEAIAGQQDVEKVMVFLQGHGLGPGLATRIVRQLGRGAISAIQADPYRLVDDVIGVGFPHRRRPGPPHGRCRGLARAGPSRRPARARGGLEPGRALLPVALGTDPAAPPNYSDPWMTR